MLPWFSLGNGEGQEEQWVTLRGAGRCDALWLEEEEQWGQTLPVL